jgi:hypothetical protein
MEITRTSIQFGRNVGAITSACNKNFICFRRPLDRKLWEMDINMRFRVTQFDRQTYYGSCLVLPLRQSLSPAFLDFLKERSQEIFSHYAAKKKIRGFVQEKKYWIFTLMGMAALWDADRRKKTRHSYGLIASITKKASDFPVEFSANIIKELEELDEYWFEKFLTDVGATGIGEYTFGMVLITLKVFWEGLKLPEHFTDADYRELSLYLKSSAKKGPF